MDFNTVREMPPLPEIPESAPPGPSVEQKPPSTPPTGSGTSPAGAPAPAEEDDPKTFLIPLLISIGATLLIGGIVMYVVLVVLRRPGIEPGTRIAPGAQATAAPGSPGSDIIRDDGTRGGAGSLTVFPTPTPGISIPDRSLDFDIDRLPTQRPLFRNIPPPDSLPPTEGETDPESDSGQEEMSEGEALDPAGIPFTGSASP